MHMITCSAIGCAYNPAPFVRITPRSRTRSAAVLDAGRVVVHPAESLASSLEHLANHVRRGEAGEPDGIRFRRGGSPPVTSRTTRLRTRTVRSAAAEGRRMVGGSLVTRTSSACGRLVSDHEMIAPFPSTVVPVTLLPCGSRGRAPGGSLHHFYMRPRTLAARTLRRDSSSRPPASGLHRRRRDATTRIPSLPNSRAADFVNTIRAAFVIA